MNDEIPAKTAVVRKLARQAACRAAYIRRLQQNPPVSLGGCLFALGLAAILLTSRNGVAIGFGVFLVVGVAISWLAHRQLAYWRQGDHAE